jgi:hypothetical protein
MKFIPHLATVIIGTTAAAALGDSNEVLCLNPNSDSANKNRAVARFFQKDLQGALLDWDQAIRLNPYFTDAELKAAVKRNPLRHTTCKDLSAKENS